MIPALTLSGIKYTPEFIRSATEPLQDIAVILQEQNRPHHAATLQDIIALLHHLATHTTP